MLKYYAMIKQTREEENGAQEDNLPESCQEGQQGVGEPEIRQDSEEYCGISTKPKARQKELKLALIEWEDSLGCGDKWESIEALAPAVPVCRSVGWLVHESMECVVVVPHVGKDGHDLQIGCGDMLIPRRSILRITPLQDG